jgi:hypothetical protein
MSGRRATGTRVSVQHWTARLRGAKSRVLQRLARAVSVRAGPTPTGEFFVESRGIVLFILDLFSFFP